MGHHLLFSDSSLVSLFCSVLPEHCAHARTMASTNTWCSLCPSSLRYRRLLLPPTDSTPRHPDVNRV